MIGSASHRRSSTAIRKGVARNGSHLYPVFSYDHFTKLSDEDVRALYAYFMTRTPIHAPAQPTGIPGKWTSLSGAALVTVGTTGSLAANGAAGCT